MILYHKSNLVYTVVFPQFLIFQQNNIAQTSLLIFFTSRHYYFFEKLKIVEKQLCKLNCLYGKVSHVLKWIKSYYGLNKIFEFFFEKTLKIQLLITSRKFLFSQNSEMRVDPLISFENVLIYIKLFFPRFLGLSSKMISKC